MHTCPGLSSLESVHGILYRKLKRDRHLISSKEKRGKKEKKMKRIWGIDINQ